MNAFQDQRAGFSEASISGVGQMQVGGAETDAVSSYFECITACSLDDGECVTRCVEVLREQP